jgi:hypothetical protein
MPELPEMTGWRPCGWCGGDGVVEGDCTCGDDTCCCLYPEPPVCPHYRGAGGWKIPWSEANSEDGDIV